MRKVGIFFGKLLNVRPGEWQRLLLLYGMSLIALIGLTWGDAIVQAAFLQRVGIQYLPWIFVGSATCSILAIFIYSAFADRVSNTRLLLGLLIVSGVGIVLCLAWLAAGWFIAAYVLLYLVLNVPLLDLYNVHWATYVNGFYDIRAAKRIVPVLGTTECLAGIIAGLSMPLMNRLLSPPSIIGVMLLMLMVMAVLAATMPRLLHEQPDEPLVQKTGAEEGNRLKLLVRDYRANLREGYQQIVRSPFLLWMALSTFSMTVLLAFINYSASAIFLEKLKTTVAISDYIGVLSGVANLVVLPIQLFLLSRLITRLGLGNASLIYPATTLAAVGGLAFAPTLGTAGLAYLDRTAFRNAFRLPTDNLLYNAVPMRVKARTRAFIGGLLIPSGTIIGGLLLLTPFMRINWFLPAGMIVLALTFAVSAWMVRQHYRNALVDLLEQEDYSALALQPATRQTPSALTNDPAMLTHLSQKLTESAGFERTIFIAQLITAVYGEAGVPVIRKAAFSTTDNRIRASLVDVLAAADIRGSTVRDFYTELLSDPDPLVRLSAIGGLEQVEGMHDARYLEIAARMLDDPVQDIQLRVLPVLLSVEDGDCHVRAALKLRELLKSSDSHTRACALNIVGQSGSFGFLMELVRSLTDSEDEVRLAAALATESLAGSDLLAGKRDMLLVLALLLLRDPIERARVAAVTVLDRLSVESGLGAAAAGESLVSVLADPSEEVRDRAIDALVRIGPRIIPIVQEQLTFPETQYHKMSAVVLARIKRNKYGAYVLGELLEQNLGTIYKNINCLTALSACPGQTASVLQQALVEHNSRLLQELFYLISAVWNPTTVNAIVKSLRSQHLGERANAVEALESLTAPKTAALIAPLLDPDQPSQMSLTLDNPTWDVASSTPLAALRSLLIQGENPWQRTLAAAVLTEMSESADHSFGLEIAELLREAQTDPDLNVQAEANRKALHRSDHDKPARIGNENAPSEALSLVEKLMFLKNVGLFRGLTTDQLRDLAQVCDVVFCPTGSCLYQEGDPGGVLYIIVDGVVRIDRKKSKDSSAQLAMIEAGGYFGETDFFDGNRRTTSAIAITDTLTIRLLRQPMILLARQNPDFSLQLVTTLSSRLREATEQIADLTKTHPQILHKLYDQLSEFS